MIEELSRFIQTAHEGNITRTAAKIFITQSALSQSIKRLEHALDTKLFMQHGKQLELTNDGKSLVTIGGKILQLWENAKNPSIRSSTKQLVLIGMFDNAAIRLGSYLENALRSDTYAFELTIHSSTKLFSQLQFGVLDIAVCVISEKNPIPKSITLVQKFREELIPVSAKKFSMKLEQLPFILYNAGSNTREQINAQFIAHHTQPYIFAESTSTTFMKELAILGNGITLLPFNAVKSEIANRTLLKHKLPFKVYREYGVYTQDQSNENEEIVGQICRELQK